MVQNDKLSVTEQQNAQHKIILRELLRDEGNRRCADCLSRGPTWASVNLGVFVCLNCSGIHRSLGVHNSKVRSTNLDTWLPEQVAFVRAMGNVRGNAFWEGRLPKDFRRPLEADMAALRVFITDKYVNRKYCLQGYNEPPGIENYESHPWFKSIANGGAVQSSSSGSAAVAPRPPPAPPARSIPSASAPPPATHFDLLSLDDPVPAVPAVPAAVGAWDPFEAAAAQVPLQQVQPVPQQPQAQQAPHDPFDLLASMERSASRSSSTTTTSTKIAPLADPFAISEKLPPAGGVAAAVPNPVPVAQPGAVPAVPLMAPTSSGGVVLPGGLGHAPMAMRTTSGSVHSKGSLSHEDILAMFDRPAAPRAANGTAPNLAQGAA